MILNSSASVKIGGGTDRGLRNGVEKIPKATLAPHFRDIDEETCSFNFSKAIASFCAVFISFLILMRKDKRNMTPWLFVIVLKQLTLKIYQYATSR